MNRDELKEKAFDKRYGKKVKISVDNVIENGVLTKYTLSFHSKKDYEITEYLKDGVTDYVTLSIDGKLFRFNRFIDCEVTLADLISEE